VVGDLAGDLVMPDDLPRLLPSMQTAIDAALTDNPSVVEADTNVDIAKADVDINNRARLPSLALASTLSRNRTQKRGGTVRTIEKSASATLTLTIPLYQSGAELSRVRAAKKEVGQRKLDRDVALRLVRQTTISAWQNLIGARARVKSFKQEVESAGVAHQGITEEFDVGRRSLLDVVDAQKELNNAKVNLIGAQRDVIVFTYTVLSAVGQLNARSLELPVKVYDVEIDYDNTQYNLYDTSVEPETPVSAGP
jgi:outer membrane protein TolC